MDSHCVLSNIAFAQSRGYKLNDMEVSFSLEPDDLRAFQRESGGRRVQIGCLLILLSMVVAFVINWVREGSIGAEFAIVIVLWMSFLFMRWQERGQIQKEFDRNRDRLTNQHIRLTPEELIHSSAVGIGATRWEAIRRIRETDTHVFIFTSDTSAIVVPRRAFADKRAFREFMEEAGTYHARALESRGHRNG